MGNSGKIFVNICENSPEFPQNNGLSYIIVCERFHFAEKKVIGRKKYQKLSGNNKPSFIAGNIDLAFNSSLIPHSSVCKDH